MSVRSKSPRATRLALLWVLCAVGLGAGSVSALQAPSADIHGVWWNEHPLQRLAPDSGGNIPFTDQGRALYDASQKATQSRSSQPPGRNSVSQCLPLGPTRILQQPFPLQIVQKGGLVVLLYEHNHVYEIVYLNQSADPDRDPAFMGNSTGQWAADGLVIVTSGFKAGTLLDDSGLPHSEQLSLRRVIKTVQGGRGLAITTTISDPVMFTAPWSYRQVLTRRAGTAIEEYTCGQGPTLETRYTRGTAPP